MQKILFTEFAELRQGDGKGPKFLAGKAYWLTDDQAWRWKGEGVAEDAPADMAAENEEARGADPLRPEHVTIVRAGRNRHHVLVRGEQISAAPLTAAEAERLRQRVLAGDVKAPTPELPLPPAASYDLPDKIVFRTRMIDGERVIFVEAPWPKRVRVAASFLADADGEHISVVHDQLNLTVANGIAAYRIGADDDGPGSHLCELIEGMFDPDVEIPDVDAKNDGPAA